MNFRILPTWLPVIALGASSAFGVTADPFPNPIPKGAAVVQARDFAVIPDFNGQTPRVHQLLAAPDGRIFVLDQLGAIYAVSADGKKVTLYLNLAAVPGVDLINSGEQGLESVAFHPDFLNSGKPGYGKFYTAHTSGNTAPAADFTPGGGDNADDNVVLEWRAANPAAAKFTATNAARPFREVLRVEAPWGNHTIGLVAFNPNSAPGSADHGKLYVGLGDGGNGGDPLDLAQNRAKAHGKILRIDPLGANSTNGKYGIPSDNPFVGASGTIPEIWALGFRNPQRFSWDRGGAKKMFIADIGQGTIEEIDIGVAGANYGWRRREGSYVFHDPGSVDGNARADAGATGFTYPIAEYDHDEGASVTAGIVYRAKGIPALRGQFLFGDIALGRVFTIDGDRLPRGGQTPIRELRLRFGAAQRSLLEQIQLTHPDADRVDLRFGADRSGRVFLLNKQDGIVRVLTAVPAIPPTVTVDGNSVRSTSARAIVLRGAARSSIGLRAVQVQVDSQPRRNARGLSPWRLPVKLHDGRNRIVVQAVDQNGARSAKRGVVVNVR